MDTSLAFLGLVEARPGHGYELKQLYDEHFGDAKPLAYGQVYAMLARFARDDLIEMVGVEDGSGPSRKQYRGLPEGRKRVIEWLMTTDEDATVSRTNLFAKVVVALLLDEDVTRILNAQRSALLNEMRQLTRAKRDAGLLDVLAHDHALLRVEADIRWIDLAEARLTNLKETLS
ncbi:PadR family transcriptional regulator [Microbacterium caowuchunii]|uniref:PadR family transcriptional regulator n=1 Tax=Microbacterium caowuchunii TaxID=2614638 RepID=A0A5N0T8R5_9MICO|nr:helix-turn-helix transcriptional regulator [Microbacterium caowuchunii]KAA9130226.1 PadR family transcriptional regulator [Microbacterium caowuchunii]